MHFYEEKDIEVGCHFQLHYTASCLWKCIGRRLACAKLGGVHKHSWPLRHLSFFLLLFLSLSIAFHPL